LHHVENSGPIETDDMIVLDVGASVEHYAADITRTVSKQPMNDRQRAIFDAVVAVQDYALTLLRPGILLQEYERAVEVFMGRQLQKLHIITEPTHENVRTYFPHATSHFLGLDTHDVGDYRLPLQAGMVVTCEPGIYVAEERIGIRIEDDVLITETGNTVLSNACPRRI
jgi:Xaa-Pro aminopeptidase